MALVVRMLQSFSNLVLNLKKIWQSRVILTLLLVFLLSFVALGSISYRMLYAPVHQSGLLYLPKRASAKVLSDILYQKHLIRTPWLFRMLLRQTAWASQLKPGTYLYSSNDSIWTLIHKIIRGDVYKVSFSMIEGSRLCELLETMSKAKDFQFNPSMLDVLPKEHPSLEGLLFPSTYIQAYGESVLPVLKLAYQTMQKNLTDVWQSRAPNLPYQDPYQLLIAASIIEKETAVPEERPLISAVIRNRLQKGMRLQMDPTVAYGMPGCLHRILKGSDLKYDSPYNTYMHSGLPPTPIAFVSMASLRAAAHPANSDYLYFVAKGDGHHEFSSDYQHQQKAVNFYLRTPHD